MLSQYQRPFAMEFSDLRHFASFDKLLTINQSNYYILNNQII